MLVGALIPCACCPLISVTRCAVYVLTSVLTHALFDSAGSLFYPSYKTLRAVDRRSSAASVIAGSCGLNLLLALAFLRLIFSVLSNYDPNGYENAISKKQLVLSYSLPDYPHPFKM